MKDFLPHYETVLSAFGVISMQNLRLFEFLAEYDEEYKLIEKWNEFYNQNYEE